jgi:hypothetical protein
MYKCENCGKKILHVIIKVEGTVPIMDRNDDELGLNHVTDSKYYVDNYEAKDEVMDCPIVCYCPKCKKEVDLFVD